MTSGLAMRASPLERRRNLRWALLALACPVVLAGCVLAGGTWRQPGLLFTPDYAGILELRLWRVFLAAVVGAALSLSGASLQAVLRNPLAEPYVLGLSSGAGLGTVMAVLLGGLAWGAWVQPAAGFAGAMASLWCVYRLALFGGRTAPHTLILAGVVWGAVCTSLLFFLVSQASVEGVHAVLWWMLGDLQVFDSRLAMGVALLTGVGGVLLYGMARPLNALTFGEDIAGSVGVEPERARRHVLVLASLLTAAAVSVSGLIGFVGLVAPHAMRAWVGPHHRRLLPAAALGGAMLLAGTDALGRTLLYPVEIPAGVLSALVGGPFFLALLRRHQKQVWV